MLLSVEIGKNIVALRKLRGLTQEQLALRTEMSVSYLRSIEHGRANPTIQTLTRLSETLEVPTILLIVLSQEKAELDDMIRRFKQTIEETEQEMVM